MIDKQEIAACRPHPVTSENFHDDAILSYKLTIKHVERSMPDFVVFLGFVNEQIVDRGIQLLERFLMPATFSSMVREFMKSAIPTFCSSIVANRYHNGHPDLIPVRQFPENSVQQA